MTKIPVGIVGFRGYSGVELERLLARHPQVAVYRLEHRQDAEHRPEPLNNKVPPSIPCTASAALAAGIEVVFLATPVEVSMELTIEFLASNIRIIDLSGAFRLGTVENFSRWYTEEHKAPNLM